MQSTDTLVLDERMSIAQASGLHQKLCERVTAGGTLVIDGSRVEEIDAAILQLLVSLWRSAADRNLKCSWHAASEPLRRAARLIGVQSVLELPDAAAKGSLQ